MRKNLLKRATVLFMAAFMMVMSLTPAITNGNYEISTCSDIKPNRDPYDDPVHL